MVTHSKCSQEEVLAHFLGDADIGAGPVLEALPEHLLRTLERTVWQGIVGPLY
jgi:hypothetical protein